jgi:chemotaxis protein CheD
MIEMKNIIGAMAHIMLPGSAPENKNFGETKYASNAIEEMLKLLKLKGAAGKRLNICLFGGGNVLKRNDDTICIDNLTSVENILKTRLFQISKKAVGGTVRRSARLYIESGQLYFTEDNSPEKLLWKS